MMSANRAGALPSAMDFPDVIRPVTAGQLGELYTAFGLNGGRAYSAEVRYERLSSRIAGWTGYEHTHDRHGRPFNRAEWHENVHRSLDYLNRELALGMDRQFVDVLSLCYLALQESPRYCGDAAIEPVRGENTAVHSIHTILQAFRVFQKTLEEKPELKKNLAFFQSFQMTCLMMAVHDLGEMLGEAGSLAQVANTGNWAVKDKSAYERAVFSHGVRLAISAVIDKTMSEADFMRRIDTIRAGSNIQNQGLNKSDSDMVREVSAHMGDDVPLSARGRKLFGFMSHLWEMVEDPGHSDNPFLGYLAAVCERTQGTRHINRMVETAKSPHLHEDGRLEMIPTHSLMNGKRMVTNALYTEGHLGPMCHAIDPASPFQKDIARQAVAWAYEAVAGFFSMGPEAFFTDARFPETAYHADGSPLAPEEVAMRRHEITVARTIAEAECKAILSGHGGGRDAGEGLCGSFAAAACPIGRVAVLRQPVLEMYRRAIAQGYLPGMVEAGGKSRSEVLILDTPAALVGVGRPDVVCYPKRLQSKIESARQMLELKG